VLDEESEKVINEMEGKVKGRFTTGQCDGWKNVSKSSIIGTMVNVEYKPHLLNTIDISALPKTVAELLKIVLEVIQYVTEELKVHIVAWCNDASGESA
ncbi:hypothetical protein PAXRUDRAFT_77865, partial [Paxillus rubicundulus Ve08.2h10]